MGGCGLGFAIGVHRCDRRRVARYSYHGTVDFGFDLSDEELSMVGAAVGAKPFFCSVPPLFGWRSRNAFEGQGRSHCNDVDCDFLELFLFNEFARWAGLVGRSNRCCWRDRHRRDHKDPQSRYRQRSFIKRTLKLGEV